MKVEIGKTRQATLRRLKYLVDLVTPLNELIHIITDEEKIVLIYPDLNQEGLCYQCVKPLNNQGVIIRSFPKNSTIKEQKYYLHYQCLT